MRSLSCECWSIRLKPPVQRVGRQVKCFRQWVQGKCAGINSILTIQHFAQNGPRAWCQPGERIRCLKNCPALGLLVTSRGRSASNSSNEHRSNSNASAFTCKRGASAAVVVFEPGVPFSRQLKRAFCNRLGDDEVLPMRMLKFPACGNHGAFPQRPCDASRLGLN
jgi:hypothetical protein